MKNLKTLKFVSVEGFWEKEVHEARVAEAAKKLVDNPSAFAIATATYAPPPSVSFTNIPLGKYTSNKLIQEFGIPSSRILPAYLFDQKTTYTIIDAYSNAIMIGWLCCGLTQCTKTVHAELYPVTAGFPEQAERILTLNTRSLKPLASLGISVKLNLDTSNIIPFEQLLINCPEEANKLIKIKQPGELIATGCWNGNSGIKRCFDDIGGMRNEIVNAFRKIFASNINYQKLFSLTNIERLFLTYIWNIKASGNIITNNDINNLYNTINDYFAEEITDDEINIAHNNLIQYGFINS